MITKEDFTTINPLEDGIDDKLEKLITALLSERDEALANLECARKEMMAALDRMNEERRWKEAYREVAMVCDERTEIPMQEWVDAEAKRIVEKTVNGMGIKIKTDETLKPGHWNLEEGK